MALLTNRKWGMRVEGLGAGFDIAKAAIDGGQFGAQAEDGNVDSLAALAAEGLFGLKDQATG